MPARLIQHKREALWFYRFVSLGYDRWINPLFWTPAMRTRALDVARLDDRSLRTVDVGAGTGFTTEGIVAHVDAANVTAIDQSPHQLARLRAKPQLAACETALGDAERLPFADDTFDRYVSAGSIEYWPDPLRGIAEAYRVVRPGGIAVVVGPLRPRNRAARWLADLWMLFPEEREYREWFAQAGFADVTVRHLPAPWQGPDGTGYAVAVAGTKPAAGPSPAPLPAAAEEADAPLGIAGRLAFAGRFVAGSLAGAAFIPVGLALAFRARLRSRAGEAAG